MAKIDINKKCTSEYEQFVVFAKLIAVLVNVDLTDREIEIIYQIKKQKTEYITNDVKKAVCENIGNKMSMFNLTNFISRLKGKKLIIEFQNKLSIHPYFNIELSNKLEFLINILNDESSEIF